MINDPNSMPDSEPTVENPAVTDDAATTTPSADSTLPRGYEPIHPDAQKATTFILGAIGGLAMILFLAIVWAFGTATPHTDPSIAVGEPNGQAACPHHDRMKQHHMGGGMMDHKGNGHHDGMMNGHHDQYGQYGHKGMMGDHHGQPYPVEPPVPMYYEDDVLDVQPRPLPVETYPGMIGGPAVDVPTMPGIVIPQGMNQDGIDWNYAEPVTPDPYMAPNGSALMDDPRLDWGYAIPEGDPMMVPENPTINQNGMVYGESVPEIASDPADAFVPRLNLPKDSDVATMQVPEGFCKVLNTAPDGNLIVTGLLPC